MGRGGKQWACNCAGLAWVVVMGPNEISFHGAQNSWPRPCAEAMMFRKLLCSVRNLIWSFLWELNRVFRLGSELVAPYERPVCVKGGRLTHCKPNLTTGINKVTLTLTLQENEL